MNRRKGLIIGIIALVAVTSIISFAISAVFFYGWNILNPSYSIYFDPAKTDAANISKFKQVKNILESAFYEDVDLNNLIEGAISGMAYSLKDPYTVYYTKEQMAAFIERTKGSFIGIGVHVTTESDGLLTVMEVFQDSPALKAGLKQGDKIVKVGDIDVIGMNQDDVVGMIRGVENTSVKLTIYRQSLHTYMDFDVTRKSVKTPNIDKKLLSDNIGYIRIKEFDEDIAAFFEKNLNELLALRIKGLIIDLRDNGGGSYDQVVKIADRLLPEGVVVYTEDKYKRQQKEYSDSKELGIPVAVLVNGNSASASEVLAGAIKDYNKGTLVGTKTYGKGVVQIVKQLDDGSGLKVTIARYFTPSGVCIDKIGIQPDLEVKPLEKYEKMPVASIPNEEDSQLKAGIEMVKKAIGK